MAIKSNTDVVFPAFSGNVSNMSAEFASSESIILLQVRGLKIDQEVRIEVAFADDCDIVTWIPFVDCCGQVKLRFPETFLVLPIPLRYRAILVDKDDLYLTDPSIFIDVQMRVNRLNTRTDLTKFYHGCCPTNDKPGCIIVPNPIINCDNLCDGVVNGVVSPELCQYMDTLPLI
jgi:hypothetical protein